ncbi:MAG: site-specific DNA-methyltransferase, partial [Acidobacteria bacterium]
MRGSVKAGELWTHEVASSFNPEAEAVIAHGDCLEILRALPDSFAKLIITSPPYNVGKVYEKATKLTQYLASINPVVDELVRVISPEGSLCWQVGNYVENGEVF